MITTRAEFEAAQRATDKQLRAMFEQMTRELAGMVTQAADVDGVVPPAKAEEVRAKARAIVQRYFVQERPINGQERAKESERLHSIIEDTQKAMRGATEREKIQLRGRVTMLSRRLALLQQGTALVAYDANGNGITPYARAIREGALMAIRAVIQKHTDYVKKRIQDANTSK